MSEPDADIARCKTHLKDAIQHPQVKSLLEGFSWYIADAIERDPTAGKQVPGGPELELLCRRCTESSTNLEGDSS